MTQYSGQLTQLIQGVSQQHPKDRAEGQNSAQVNCISDVVEGLRRRPAFKVLAELTGISTGFTLNSNTAVYSYSRGDGTEEYIFLIDTAGNIKVYDAFTGIEKTVTNTNQSYLVDSNPRQNLRFHTIGDTTFCLNTNTDIEMDSTSASPGLANEAILYAVRASYGHTYKVLIDDVVKASVTTPTTVTISSTTQNKQLNLSSSDIMDSLVNGTTRSGWTVASNLTSTLPTWTFDLKEDVCHVSAPVAFQISTSDGNHGNDLKGERNVVRAFEDLPKFAPKDYKIQITGTGDERFDNYWVKWKPDNDSSTNWAGSGEWQECIGPGLEVSIDADTMPTTIRRKADGTFENVVAEWVDRAAGDADTNPEPSFIGTTAQDIGSYQNRLFMLTGENVVMTRAFDQLAWFAESVAQAADDDPVDSASSDNQVTDLMHAVIFNGSFVVFSNNAQFIHPGDVSVLPATFSVSSDTKFNVSPLIKPVVTGTNIMFPTDFGDYVNVWEYNLNSITGSPQCESTTKHIPRYIKGNPLQMVANTTTDYVFVRTDEDDTKIYVQQFYTKNRERAQLAWHEWDIPNCDALYSMTLLNQRLFTLVQRGSSVFLEYVDLSLPPATNSAYELYLDHYYSDVVEHGAWEISGREYVNRIPVNEADIDTFVQGGGCRNEGFLITQYEVDSGYVYCNVADDPDVAYIISGYRFTSSGTVTNPFIKDSNDRPYTRQTIIEDVTFNVQRTGWIVFTIAHAAGEDYTETFNGQVLNNWQFNIGEVSLLDKDLYLPVRDYRELVTLSFSSDHHLGFAIMSMDWLCRMQTRGRRSR